MTNRQREWSKFRRDPYVRWIKSLPCSVQGAHAGPIDPNHHPTVGSTGQVHRRIMPLCRGHHTELGDVGVESFQRKYGIDFEAFISALEVVYRDGVLQKRFLVGRAA